MMPVEKLPAASWQTAFGLGFLSGVFDNIPLPAFVAHGVAGYYGHVMLGSVCCTNCRQLR
jgi:Na+/H+ antiporter NhaD/arsenite permease-like protein